MPDKRKLIEILSSIKETGQAKGNYLTKKEIKSYLDGMDLDEEQYQHVYTYLGENNIKVEGHEMVGNKEEKGDDPKEGWKACAYLKMYLDELQKAETMEKQEEEACFAAYLAGKKGEKDRLLSSFLQKVVDIAKEYENRGISLEDLIQEGNIGLLKGLDSLSGIKEISLCHDFILDSIRQEIEQAIDLYMDDTDWESAVLAKANLVGEAANYLAEELGRAATMEELSGFTKIPVQEIENVVKLSLDAISIGDARIP